MDHRTACLSLVLCLGSSTVHAAPPTHVTPETGWQRTFNDDFDCLDISRWTTLFPWGGRYIPGSKEEEIYVDPKYVGTSGKAPLGLNPFSVAEGILTITADRVSPTVALHLGGRMYTSGVLTSYRSFSQLYGYFEMRAKLPPGRGLWPAFWLLPIALTWPPEIDIVEAVNNPTKLFATIHYGVDRKAGFALVVPDMTNAFHTYGVIWAPRFVAWYLDDALVASTPTPSDMHKPMYLLLDLAVGGSWAKSPPADTVFPARLQVDYIRAYALPPNLDSKVSGDSN